jgi:microcystin-dependent protein
MATITGLTAQRMLDIESASVVDGEVVSGSLILATHGGASINAGSVIGPVGPVGPVGPMGSIPGEVKLWPGGALPDLSQYGKWVWADGAVYVAATYPKAAANIAAQWRTFSGASDPGATNFRVPDMRGLVPAGLDAMPGGSRANRMTRAVAITLAGRAGEETHIVTVAETPAHGHTITDPGHAHSINDPKHAHSVSDPTHAHSISDPTHTHTGIQGGGSTTGGGGPQGVPDSTPMTPNSSATGIAIYAALTGIAIYAAATGIGIYSAYAGINGTNNAGGGGAHENVQPTVFVPYIVCLNG